MRICPSEGNEEEEHDSAFQPTLSGSNHVLSLIASIIGPIHQSQSLCTEYILILQNKQTHTEFRSNGSRWKASHKIDRSHTLIQFTLYFPALNLPSQLSTRIRRVNNDKQGTLSYEGIRSTNGIMSIITNLNIT